MPVSIRDVLSRLVLNKKAHEAPLRGIIRACEGNLDTRPDSAICLQMLDQSAHLICQLAGPDKLQRRAFAHHLRHSKEHLEHLARNISVKQQRRG